MLKQGAERCKDVLKGKERTGWERSGVERDRERVPRQGEKDVRDEGGTEGERDGVWESHKERKAEEGEMRERETGREKGRERGEGRETGVGRA